MMHEATIKEEAINNNAATKTYRVTFFAGASTEIEIMMKCFDKLMLLIIANLLSYS